MKSWIAPGVLLLLATIASAADKQTDLSDYFPQNTMIYMTADDLQATNAVCAETAYARIWNDPQLLAFLQPLREMLQAQIRELGDQTGVSEADLAACFERRCALGVVGPLPGSPMPSVLLACELVDPQVGSRIIDALPALLKKAEPRTVGEPVLGPDGIVRIPLQGLMMSAAMDGSVLLVSLDMGGQVLAMRRQSKGVGTIRDVPAFAAAKAALADRQDALMFVNGAQVMPLLLMGLSRDRDSAQLIPVLQSLGLADTRGLTLGIRAKAPGFLTSVFINASEPRRGLYALLKSGPVNPDLLKGVPADAVYCSSSRVDLSLVTGLIRACVREAGGPEDGIEQGLAMGQQMLGVHLERDLLAHLGDESVTVVLDPEKVQGMPLLGLNGLVVVTRVKNAPALRESLGRLVDSLGRLAETQLPQSGAATFEIHGTQARGIRLLNLIVPCAAVTDDVLIAALHPDAIRQVMETTAGERPRLVESDEYLQTLAALPHAEQGASSFARAYHLSMPGSDIQTTAMMSGLLLPALTRARSAARKTNSTNHLKQIGLAIEMHGSDQYYAAMPQSLADLYQNGRGIIGDPKVFQCPETKQGYHFVSGLGLGAKANDVLAYSVPVDKQGGEPRQLVLYRDGHVSLTNSRELEKEIMQTLQRAQARGETPKILDPWLPEGLEPEEQEQGQEDQGLFSLMESDPQAFMDRMLALFPAYKLPAIHDLNRHLFASAGLTRILPEGILLQQYGPFPLFNPAGGMNGFGIGGQSSTASMAIIAAVAIPNLLQSRMQANEANAVAALKACATGQITFKKAKYDMGKYANSLKLLGDKQLLPPVMIAADSPHSAGYQGYWFKVTGDMYDFRVYANPCSYGKSGINSFYIDASGTVFMKDNGGEAFTEGKPDDTWLVP